MSTHSSIVRKRRSGPATRIIASCVAALVVLGAMAASTKVVHIGSGSDVQPGVFSPAEYGKQEFPKIQSAIEARAVDAKTLADAIGKDPAAAAKQYAVGQVFSVKFTGLVGNGDGGVYDVKAEGLGDTPAIHLQTGPAILGTDLRDATGTISFGQFTNQIEYQNAGSALNKQMKKDVLSGLDTSQLTGKTVSVVGAFTLGGDPNSWTVTPVKLEVR